MKKSAYLAASALLALAAPVQGQAPAAPPPNPGPGTAPPSPAPASPTPAAPGAPAPSAANPAPAPAAPAPAAPGAAAPTPAAAGAAAPAQAAPTQAQQMGPARVSVTKNCPSRPVAATDTNEVGPLLGAALSIGTGLVSDLIKAGIETGAAALEEASKERAIGGQGYGYFPFYSLVVDPAGRRMSLDNYVGKNMAGCLVVAIDSVKDPKRPLHPADGLPDGAKKLIADWTVQPAVYAEVEMRSSGDGFLLRPNLIWYGQALRGLPRGRVATEFHASFLVPAAADPSTGAFAVARIMLPPMQPGDIHTRERLASYTSAALPLRPTAGSVDTLKTTVDGLLTSIVNESNTIEDEELKLRHAEEDAAIPGADAAAKVKPTTVRRLIEAARMRRARAERQLGQLLPTNAKTLGTTTVSARIAFVRQPDRFGLAIAQALKARAPTAAASVGTALGAELDPVKWSAQDTALVQAAGLVRTAQQAYDAAMAGTDAAVQQQTLAALNNAKAAANAAAEAADKPIPYPELRHQMGRI